MQSLEFDHQKFNAELDDMIARKEIERGSLIAPIVKKLWRSAQFQ